jgi:hypothetical protein
VSDEVVDQDESTVGSSVRVNVTATRDDEVSGAVIAFILPQKREGGCWQARSQGGAQGARAPPLAKKTPEGGYG